MGDIAIKVENLSKYYNLGVINSGTLSRDLQSWLWKRMGKEDPNRKIGVHEDTSNGFWALKDLNFEIKKGERIGIIGKNGAGKSTLLKMLSQISAPTEGRIYIDGKVASLLEVGTGFNPELTGRENIYMNGAILGMKKREIDAKIDEIIAFSEIERHIDTPVKRYSSGMYVRLAFAVAAHLDSNILIADEVLAVGDVNFQKKAIGKMNELSSGEGRTVLFVSHNMAAVTSLCMSGIVLSNGKLVLQEDIEKCKSMYLSISSDEIVNGAEWHGDIGDDNIRFYSACLYSEYENKNKTNVFFSGDTIELKTEYEILLPNPNYVFCIHIYHDDIGLIECSATEFFSEELSVLNEKGRHILSVFIDTSIFAQGKYSIKFDWSIRNTKSILWDKLVLPFTVENSQEMNTTFIPHRTNIISPKWKWKHQIENKKSEVKL